MELMDMNHLDNKLRLLYGEIFFVDNIEIKPYLLKDIIELGFTKYHQYLGILSKNTEDLIDLKLYPEFSDMSVFEIILSSGQEYLISPFVNGLSFFIREPLLSAENGILVFGDPSDAIENRKFVTKDNFKEIVNILEYQNYMKNGSKIEDSPATDKAKYIMDKIKKAKEYISKKTANSSEDNDFYDVVSAVSTKSNSINKFNVWDLTLYQLCDEFKRLDWVVNCEQNLLAIMNGAKNIDLNHWSGKMK